MRWRPCTPTLGETIEAMGEGLFWGLLGSVGLLGLIAVVVSMGVPL